MLWLFFICNGKSWPFSFSLILYNIQVMVIVFFPFSFSRCQFSFFCNLYVFVSFSSSAIVSGGIFSIFYCNIKVTVIVFPIFLLELAFSWFPRLSNESKQLGIKNPELKKCLAHRKGVFAAAALDASTLASHHHQYHRLVILNFDRQHLLKSFVQEYP